MTAHGPKLTLITPEAVEAFARYYLEHCEYWGVFDYAMGGNFKFGAGGLFTQYTKHESSLVRYFEQLTPSQRRRLRDKAQDKAAALKLEQARAENKIRQAEEKAYR